MTVRRSVILFIILVFCLVPGSPVRSQAGPDPARTKVLLDNQDLQSLEAMTASGAQRLIDYGAFSLWSVPPSDPRALSLSGALVPVDQDIYLRELVISTQESAGPFSSPASGAAIVDTPGPWMVQFIGPVLPEWEQALRDAGLQVAAYLPNHAYLVWGSQPIAAIQEVSVRTQAVQWSSPYLPLYRLAPSLRGLNTSGPVDITLQIINTPHLNDTLAAVSALALNSYQAPGPLLNTTRLSIQIEASQLAGLAAWPDVINIEPYLPPEMLDEIQAQAMAGNINIDTQNGTLVASSPGYLAWLSQKGFPTQPQAYPLVEITDDGLDSGSVKNVLHPDFHLFGLLKNPGRIAYITNCSSSPSGNSVAGHGNLNAGILAGYNDMIGSPYQDELGFRLGLGISPYGPIAAAKVFNDLSRFDLANCPGGIYGLAERSYRSGARITSNSWGRPTYAEYDSEAMAYDISTRDATPDRGDQPMLHIFAAGNSGSDGPRTITSPAIAKNVLTVGASENARDPNTPDGCYIYNSDSVDDVAGFSSIGPTRGGRAKPDILAPGTHVQGPASQDPAFNGNKVCGSPSQERRYYPAGQTLYTWSSGTSHSTPAVSGAAQLIHNYYNRVMAPGLIPSPAMLKALILNTPRYMTGEYANDTLPSPTQGWGSVDMGKIFDNTPRVLLDQQLVFDRSGQEYKIQIDRASATQPVHVTLVWTDAPGHPAAGAALVNNLDLEVLYQGLVFRGNVFSGPSSISGGAADQLNNVENVFLPPGADGNFVVRVIARNLAGDGLPNRSGATDQDFALVITNGSRTPPLDHKLWLPAVAMRNAAP